MNATQRARAADRDIRVLEDALEGRVNERGVAEGSYAAASEALDLARRYRRERRYALAARRAQEGLSALGAP